MAPQGLRAHSLTRRLEGKQPGGGRAMLREQAMTPVPWAARWRRVSDVSRAASAAGREMGAPAAEWAALASAVIQRETSIA